MHPFTRLTLTFAALTLLAPGLQEITVEYNTGLSYEVRTERSRTLRLGEASMLIGGEEFPADMLSGSIPDRDEAQTIVLRDVVREAEEGRPQIIVREFVELSKQKTEAEELTEESGALEGLTLVLSLDEDGEVEAELEEGAKAELDEVYLTGHLLEHPLSSILPEDEVEPGDSWEPSDEAIRQLLFPGGPEYFEPEENKGLTELLQEEAECSAEVTFKELVDLDGVECYVLEVEAELEAYIDELPEQLQSEDDSKEGSIAVEGEYQGTLWIAVETHFPVRFESEGDFTFEIEMIMDHQGMAIEMNMELLVKASTETEWEIL